MEELSTAITAQPVLIVILLTDLTNCNVQGAGGANPPPRDDLRFSNTTGILQKKKKKKTMWFIGVEVEQETSAPPPKKKSWIRGLLSLLEKGGELTCVCHRSKSQTALKEVFCVPFAY